MTEGKCRISKYAIYRVNINGFDRPILEKSARKKKKAGHFHQFCEVQTREREFGFTD